MPNMPDVLNWLVVLACVIGFSALVYATATVTRKARRK